MRVVLLAGILGLWATTGCTGANVAVAPTPSRDARECDAIYTAINAAWVRREGAILVLVQDSENMRPSSTPAYRNWFLTQMDSVQAETVEDFIARNRRSVELCDRPDRPRDLARIPRSPGGEELGPGPELWERFPNSQGPVVAMAPGLSPDEQQALVVVFSDGARMAVRLARTDTGAWRAAETKVLWKRYRPTAVSDPR